jgi:hypothetical protein
MKKVSTAAAKQSRNVLQSNLTIGLDLGDRSSCYCVWTKPEATPKTQKVEPPRAGSFSRGITFRAVSNAHASIW